MKKQLLTTMTLIFISAIVFAQAPSKMSYQSVIRNAANALVSNQQVGIRVQILQTSEFGPVKYVETHSVSTNTNGLVTLEIGTGTIVTGNFTNIDWANGPYFIKTETDPAGGNNYSMTTLSEIMSVPYAMLATKAKTADSITNGISLDQAYHSGSAGMGRRIVADEGALLIEGKDGIEVSGKFNDGADILNYDPQGPNSKMYFNPKKGAFRAGVILNVNWDKDSVGQYSAAFGFNTKASRDYSTAMGSGTKASGLYSTAMGLSTEASAYSSTAIGYHAKASGGYSTAIGYQTSASGFFSTAMGDKTSATGHSSTAMGEYTLASGVSSTAMGEYTLASGVSSTAMGIHTLASGDYSTAIGSFVEVRGQGSMYLADNHNTRKNTSIDLRTSANTFYGRFANGYYLYTQGNAATNIGARLEAGATSWSVISDSSMKENFTPVNGKDFLDKIASMELVSWNYKGQDPKTHRHYGPMAQDFYNAFGKDEYGTIGNDSTITSADFAGVNFIAIQALVKENKELKEKLGEVDNEMAKMKSQDQKNSQTIAALEKKLRSLDQQNVETMKILQTQLEFLSTDLKEFKKYAAMQKEMEPVVKK